MNPRSPRATVKIKRVALLDNKFFAVVGPHDSPISGAFDTRAEAQAWLKRRGS